MKCGHQVFDIMKLRNLTGLYSGYCEFHAALKIISQQPRQGDTVQITFHYTQIGELTVYPCMLPKQFHNVLYISLKVVSVNDLVQYR